MFLIVFKVKHFTSLKDVIEFSRTDSDSRNDKGLDAIVLCAPTFAHDSVIKEAADHGISIFVGKKSKIFKSTD